MRKATEKTGYAERGTEHIPLTAFAVGSGAVGGVTILGSVPMPGAESFNQALSIRKATEANRDG
jgi:hypothetical protein